MLRKRIRRSRTSDRSGDEEEIASDDDPRRPTRLRRSQSHHSDSEELELGDNSAAEHLPLLSPDRRLVGALASSSSVAYRAVHEERVAMGLNRSPCVVCPVFDFCRDGGPVDAHGCVYYGSWLPGPSSGSAASAGVSVG